MRKVEILAPAGSYETMVGAFNAGADAVYMGGQLFGARAYADNPDQDGLLRGIDYAHIHGKRLYLTVNTLLKDQELWGQLYDFLCPLYEAGLDAVIVQDMGALTQIHSWFPEMDIHASTQMTVTSARHAGELRDLGVTRIVPARELQLEEIGHMKDIFGGEIECFVHGALCYCYSGQCLFSSMLGGRSGNRGRCAQPCRLPYRLADRKNSYLLSPKDICTLALIPDLVDCGIDSFKIEGRMKKPEYAAFVSAIYRKYTDMYLEHGRGRFFVDPADQMALMDLYNRGGFSEGYYKTKNGRQMMSLMKPNHFGTRAGKIISVKGQQAVFIPDIPLNGGDVLSFEGLSDRETITLKDSVLVGKTAVLKLPKNADIRPGGDVYRMRNEQLIAQIHKAYLSGEKKEKIYVSLTFFKDLPAKMNLKWADVSACVCGAVVTKAASQPLTRATVEDKMFRTGNTPYVIEKLDMEMDADAYLPLGELNRLRRMGLEALAQAVLSPMRRQAPSVDTSCPKSLCSGSNVGSKNIIAQAATLEQAAAMIQVPRVDRVYLEPWLVTEPKLQFVCQKLLDAGKEVYLALPHIFRDERIRRWESFRDILQAPWIQGFLVRNVEGQVFLRRMGCLAQKPVIADYTMYTMNRSALAYYRQSGIENTTVPVELNYRELKSRGCAGEELVVYGYLPLMVSAQCVVKTVYGCKKCPGILTMTDRKGKAFGVRQVCSECYNLIYNSQPLVLYDLCKELDALKAGGWRYIFTTETPNEALAVLSGEKPDSLTRGHFNRGVE